MAISPDAFPAAGDLLDCPVEIVQGHNLVLHLVDGTDPAIGRQHHLNVANRPRLLVRGVVTLQRQESFTQPICGGLVRGSNDQHRQPAGTGVVEVFSHQ